MLILRRAHVTVRFSMRRFGVGVDDDAVHVDAGQVDVRPGPSSPVLDDLLDLDHADLRGHGGMPG
jgi:hypothetical protein